MDGGKSWEASVVLNGHNAYSYSCLSKVGLKRILGRVELWIVAELLGS